MKRASTFVAIIISVAMAACATDMKSKLTGNWKFVSGSQPEKPVFPGMEFIRFLTDKGFYMFIGPERTGFVSPQNDTINPFPYDLRNDTMIVHTDGLDLEWKIALVGDDTLLMESQDLRLKYTRMKP